MTYLLGARGVFEVIEVFSTAHQLALQEQAEPGHRSTFSTVNFGNRQAHHQLPNPSCANTARSYSGGV